ncbi:MAG: hypothetical protein NXI30_21110 [bacterium]|nr:hypothetical protein [bacterium]
MDTGFSPALLALLGVAVIAAMALALLWRRAEARGVAQEEALEGLRSERESLTAALSRERRARAEQGEELATLRKRVDKAKKRSARAEKGAGDLPLGTASRIADLEAQIERVERERDRSRAEREQLAAQVGNLEARLEVARRPAQPAAPAAAPDAEREEGRLAEAVEQVDKLENQLELAKQSEVRMRRRMATQEQLYASIRAELDVKKDRLRAQEEKIQRLEALSAAVRSD